MAVRIGTSGWLYKHWDAVFYPPKIEKLTFYAAHFDTVEINTTFYHLPKNGSVKNWKHRTGKDFIFSIKASQYITHRKRLLNCQEPLKTFYQSIHSLREKRGPLLFQLPPSFKIDLQRLETFFNLLKKGMPTTFEFRHPSWYVPETYKLLKKYQIALCITDITGEASPLEVTSDFVYLRLHGPKKYSGSYNSRDLKKWEKQIARWLDQKIDVFCYFDNDEKGYAVRDALQLKKAFE